MTISVSDELGMNYPSGTLLGSSNTPNWGWVQGTGRGQGIIQTNQIMDEFSYYGYWYNYNDMTRQVNLLGDNTHFGNGKVAHFWIGNTFGPHQIARICHNPLQDRQFDDRNGGVTVRQSTTGDSCYLASILYVPLGGNNAPWSDTYGCGAADGGAYGLEAQPYLTVWRIKNGVYTNLTSLLLPGWTFADDWWFIELQAWGNNPVNLRVVSRAPSVYVAGSTNYNTCHRLPSICTYYLNFEPFSLYNSGNYQSSLPYGATTYNGYAWITGWPDSFVPSTGTPVLYTETDKDEPNKAWILWEGTDNSADQILEGQPGFRWADVQGQYSFVKFSAEEYPGFASASGAEAATGTGSVTISVSGSPQATGTGASMPSGQTQAEAKISIPIRNQNGISLPLKDQYGRILRLRSATGG